MAGAILIRDATPYLVAHDVPWPVYDFTQNGAAVCCTVGLSQPDLPTFSCAMKKIGFMQKIEQQYPVTKTLPIEPFLASLKDTLNIAAFSITAGLIFDHQDCEHCYNLPFSLIYASEMAASQVALKEYKYQTLAESQIRILHLQPGDGGDTIFVEMSAEELAPGLADYEALSWEWGGKPEVEVIRIKDKNSSDIRMMKIKPNLLAALRHLRLGDKIRRLWVDAICINQIEQGHDLKDDSSEEEKRSESYKNHEKNREKSNQISMITKIYGTASNVCVWLGDGNEDSTKAIDLIKRMVRLKDFDSLVRLENNDSIGHWEALIKFLKRGWFSRRWVVQEIALARSATVHCGKTSVSWSELADAITLLEKVERDGTINKLLKKLSTTNHVPESIGNISSMPAYCLVQNTTGLFRRKSGGEITTFRYSLEELVSFLAAFQASRPHDTIYAILGLTSDFKPVNVGSNPGVAEPNPGLRRTVTKYGDPEWQHNPETIEGFTIDYEMPVLEVFKRFLDRVTQKSCSLDIMCRPWAPTSGFNAKGKRETIELPSWTSSLSMKPFQPTRDRKMVRRNPDPLVGPAVFKRKIYNASGSEAMVCKIDVKDPDSKYMTVTDFILDKIGQTWDSGGFGNVPAEWLRAGGWEDEALLPPDELWRTLVADRGLDAASDPDRWYPLVFQSAVQEKGISYGFETYRLIHESASSLVTELFRRVQAVVWDRRLIRTKGGYMPWLTKKDEKRPGALGLAPKGARKDDLICIIFGCSVPLVLRRVNEVSQDTNVSDIKLSDTGYSSADTLSTNSQNPDAHPALEVTSQLGAESGDNKDPPLLCTLIGECYVDHMMDGEAIAYYRDANFGLKKKSQTFKLE